MKTSRVAVVGASTLGAVLTLGAITAINTCIPVPVPAAEGSNEPAGLAEQLKKWQAKMSEAFRDTFKDLRADPSGTQLKGSVSADLREQNDSYTLRLSLPDRDLSKVEVSLKGSTLQIAAPEDGKSRRYEQTIVLSDVSPGAKLRIDRKQSDNLILITVPKSTAAKDGENPTAESRRQAEAQRDHNTMDKMWRLQREMDSIFEDSFKPFSFMPDFKGFFDAARFGSSYTMDESDGNYVVRAYLPERKTSNVNVSIKGQTLTIEAKAENAEGRSTGDNDGASHMAHFTQMITLPGPVKAPQMKVETKEGMVVVTLPKS